MSSRPRRRKGTPRRCDAAGLRFLIHTQVGSRCVGAKVNGKLVPLNTALKSGDTVEIITDKNRRPSRDWLKIVKTAKARSRIQQYLRTEERAAAMGLGRECWKGSPQGRHQPEQGREGRASEHAGEQPCRRVSGRADGSIGYARFTTKQVVKRLQAIVSPPEILERPMPWIRSSPTASARSRARLLRPRRAASPCAAWTT